MFDYSRFEKMSDLIFRVSFSLIFIIGGLGHFGRHEEMLLRIEDSPWLELVHSLGEPSTFLYLSGLMFVIAGPCLLLGFYTRLSALALFLTLIPITFVIHIAPDHTGPLFKNVAILGGLVHFMVRGGGWYSLSKYPPHPAPSQQDHTRKALASSPEESLHVITETVTNTQRG